MLSCVIRFSAGSRGHTRSARRLAATAQLRNARPFSSHRKIGLLGACEDRNSSFMRGTALAPRLIRDAMWSDSANAYTEVGIAVARDAVEDLGDVAVPPDAGSVDPVGAEGVSQAERDAAAAEIEKAAAELLARGLSPLALGGDHSVTWPLLEAVAAYRGDGAPPLAIVHFDAHADLYDDFEGVPRSHASPFARIMERGLCARLVQLGVRTFTPHLYDQAARFGVQLLEARNWPSNTRRDVRAFLLEHLPEGCEVYVSFDMDALDPSAAPGVSHHEPGGITTRQAIDAIHAIPYPVVAADVVEYNPARDTHGVTAMAAAKLAKELAALMLRGSPLPAAW